MSDQKPLSRQRRWQLRKLQEGKCPTCGDPLKPGYTSGCERHLDFNRERMRRYWAKKRKDEQA